MEESDTIKEETPIELQPESEKYYKGSIYDEEELDPNCLSLSSHS